jgi:NAD(P)H dehydrogenase (quinone)
MRNLFASLLLLALTQIAAAQERIIVSGASGQLGGLVVEELLARKVAPQNLILVTRTPEGLKHYSSLGASVRFGDFTKPESLAAAYAGGTRMLLISVNAGGGQRPELHKAGIDAAIAAGVKQIAYTSYVNADRYTDSVIAVDHRRTERYLQESGVAWTMLRNQIYANGLPDQAVQIVRDGKLVTSTPDARVAYVTREDCAAAAAAVLTTPGHDNKAYNITGPDGIGPRELLALAEEISGKKLELVVLDEEAYRKYLLDNGTPESAVNGALSFAAELDSPYLREPSSAVADLTGRPPTSVRSLLLADKARLLAAAD